MAFQEIHRFLIAGGGPGGADITFIVNADYDTSEIYTYNDPAPAVVGPTVDATVLGFNEGDAINQRCFGTTLQGITALFNYPYAQFAPEVINSPTCGYVAPVCNVDYTTDVESAKNGLNNGKITVNMVSAGTTTFSLDNLVWQSNNVFGNLFPGNYTVYVKQTLPGLSPTRRRQFCSSSVNLTVGNDVVDVNPFTPIPYKDSNMLCWYFWLIIDGATHVVREPIGFGDVNMKGERDSEYHGYQFQYTDGQTKLKFDCAAGKDLLLAEYAAKGGDGEILFKFGYRYNGIDYELFPGKIMLNTLTSFPAWVECTVESVAFDSTFQSRMETKVSMAQDKTFDNATVLPPTPYDLELHAKETLSQFICANTNRKYGDSSFPEGTAYSILPDMSDPSSNDLAKSNSFTLLSSPSLPYQDNLWQHKFDTSGKFNLALNWSIVVEAHIKNKNLIVGGTFDAYIVFLYRKFNPANNTFTDTRELISTVNTQSFPPNATSIRSFSLTGAKTLTDVQVAINDEIYFYVQIDFSKTVYVGFLNIEQTSINYSAKLLENAGSSQANVWFLDDAINQIVKVITNNKYVFQSKFFERANSSILVDGQASKRVLTNGFQIRRFDTADRPLQVDFKTILQSLNAQNCIGLNYTTDQYGKSIVRIERRDHFYQEREILAIEELADYSEAVAVELIYNEFEIGYQTYQTDGFNSLDEFNTKRNGLTPIKKNLKKLSQLATVITSGYSLETARRAQFKEQPSESVTNDDAAFMIAVKRDSSDWKTEKNESFSTVSNLISPATSYNIRLSPTRMLINWFIWLKGVFAYKEPTDIIRNTLAVQNGALTTQFNGSETDVIGDLDKILVEEKADFTVADLESTPDIYRPEWVNFTCRLSPDKVQIINAALTGTYGSTKDYGYLMVKKPDGVWQAGWVWNLSYNFWTQKLTIKMLKKFNSPSAPNTGDCCEWLVGNGCYILANGQKLIA